MDFVERHIYHSNYFSGPQIHIYFNEVWVDDIVHLEYNLIHHKRPVYGYASELFDNMVGGVVIVQGSFTINYRYDGYLPALFGGQAAVDKRLQDTIGGGAEIVTNITNERDAAYKSVQEKNANDYAQKFNERTFGGSQPVPELDAIPSEPAIDQQRIDQLKSDFWGNANAAFNKFEESANDLRPDKLPPFNILITYGDFSYNSTFADAAATQKIYDCHITSTGQTIVADGNTQMESYQFLAKKVL